MANSAAAVRGTKAEPAAGAGSGARFSDCRRYRFFLWRKWGQGPVVNWVMLNPSTADDRVNDATIERCQRRSRQMGFGAMTVTNLFALRSTRPRELYRAADPVGPGTDEVILEWAARADRVIVAWGARGAFLDRGAAVENGLSGAGIEAYALGLTRAGEPIHPLYIPYSRKPEALDELRRPVSSAGGASRWPGYRLRAD